MNYWAKFLVIAILVGLAIRIIMHFVDKSRIKEEIETVSTTCKTSLFTGIYWAEGPQLEQPPPRIISQHRCSGCGFTLSAEWRACPNCGKTTNLA
jgi:rubrerythrin